MPMTARGSPSMVCLVCGVEGAGFHYNGQVCSCCRVFFIRQTRRAKRPTCSASWKCEIRPGASDNCRLCRYKKCLAANMQPNVVGSQPYTRKGPKRPKNPEEVERERENRRAGARQNPSPRFNERKRAPQPLQPFNNQEMIVPSPPDQMVISPTLSTASGYSLPDLSPLVPILFPGPVTTVPKEPVNFGQDLLLPLQNIDVNLLLLQQLETIKTLAAFSPLVAPSPCSLAAPIPMFQNVVL